MKNIKKGTIYAVIGMISVVVMLIWGYAANDFSHSWIAVFVGAVLATVITMIKKDVDDGNKNNKDPEG